MSGEQWAPPGRSGPPGVRSVGATARDVAIRRIRRGTRWLIAGAAALTATLVGVAVHDTPGHAATTSNATNSSNASNASNGSNGSNATNGSNGASSGGSGVAQSPGGAQNSGGSSLSPPVAVPAPSRLPSRVSSGAS